VGPRFIDKFDVILLDMARTFMFGVDRFSGAEDFGATYRRIGGRMLGDGDVCRIICGLFQKMLADSRNPAYYDCFPSVARYVETMLESKTLPNSERLLIEQVFAAHEVGTVPETDADALHRLRETHRLGVVSNIWSKKDLHLEEFRRAGIHDLFEVIVFSSDDGHLKPSAYPFARAIETLEVDRSKVVFVGDSLKRDIAGAKSVGLSAVWIDVGLNRVDESSCRPGRVSKDLQGLLEL